MTAKTWLIPAISIILVAFSGCGDPSNSRLEVGQKAMAVQPTDPRFRREENYVLMDDSGEAFWPKLPVGTHLTVIEDEDGEHRSWPSRKVKVHVEDGEHAGKAGSLTRWNVYPVK